MTALTSWQNASHFTIFIFKGIFIKLYDVCHAAVFPVYFWPKQNSFPHKKTPPAPVTLVCGCFTFQCLPCSHQRSQYMVNGNQSLPTSSPATSERHLLTEQHIHISYPILNPAGHYRLDAITGSIPTASSHICKPTGNLEAQKHGWKRLYGMCV